MYNSSIHIIDLRAFTDSEVKSLIRFFGRQSSELHEIVAFITAKDHERILQLMKELQAPELKMFKVHDALDGFSIREYIMGSANDCAIVIYSGDESISNSLAPQLEGRLYFRILPASHLSDKRTNLLERFFKRAEKKVRVKPAAYGFFHGDRIRLHDPSNSADIALKGPQSKSHLLSIGKVDEDCFAVCYLMDAFSGQEEWRNLFRGFSIFLQKSGIQSSLQVLVPGKPGKEIMDMIGHYGISEDVSVISDPDEDLKGRIFRRADVIFSLPTRKKYSLSIFKCMILGKQIVVNRNNINTQLISNNSGIFCIDHGTSQEIFNLLGEIYWRKCTQEKSKKENRENLLHHQNWIMKLANKSEVAF